ncbi:hypothetical protein [[Actinomadura] parvosata]|uniref:hypothetical protein n=1 Tax=[Actinomadura] parvosata TaxID=1955412 RepID=UPI0012BCE288|nr:hypothetical protein [Nonomuraea sp. ATCC 55076]
MEQIFGVHAMSQNQVLLTGVFSLVGAFGGILLSTLTALYMVSVTSKIQDRRELRTVRRASYARFLEAVAALESTSVYLGDVIRREASGELGKAWDLAGAANERLKLAETEVELVADAVVREAAIALADASRQRYESLGRGEALAVEPLVTKRERALIAMRGELGIAIRS